MYIGTRPLLFLSIFFILSSFQTLKSFVANSLETVRPMRLNLGTHVNSGLTLRVYHNQAVVPYSCLYS